LEGVAVAGDPVDQETIERMLAAAAEALRIHVLNAAGCCAGCLTCRGQLVMFDRCTQVEWAQVVQQTYKRPAN
jgi:hypothetical protein